MERLLFRAATKINKKEILPENVRKAAKAETCGAPDWSVVVLEIKKFQASWVGPPDNKAGPSVSWTPAGGVKHTLAITGERIDHVEKGHTYEHFDFGYGNCTRQGVNGNISFFTQGQSARAKLIELRDTGTVRTLAENAQKATNPTQDIAGGCTVGVSKDAPGLLKISQCYPNTGRIVGKTLVAIGRYLGLPE